MIVTFVRLIAHDALKEISRYRLCVHDDQIGFAFFSNALDELVERYLIEVIEQRIVYSSGNVEVLARLLYQWPDVLDSVKALALRKARLCCSAEEERRISQRCYGSFWSERVDY
jgi:hypothetical protein